MPSPPTRPLSSEVAAAWEEARQAPTQHPRAPKPAHNALQGTPCTPASIQASSLRANTTRSGDGTTHPPTPHGRNAGTSTTAATASPQGFLSRSTAPSSAGCRPETPTGGHEEHASHSQRTTPPTPLYAEDAANPGATEEAMLRAILAQTLDDLTMSDNVMRDLAGNSLLQGDTDFGFGMLAACCSVQHIRACLPSAAPAQGACDDSVMT
jgi:hypothetical protein